MTSTTRRVMFWSGLVLVLGLGLPLAYLGYCNYRAVNRLDILGVDRRVKPTDLESPSNYIGSLDEPPPVEYEYFDKRGVTDVHRVGAQIFYIAKLPVSALIVVGLILIARALYVDRQRTAGASLPIDPLAD